MSSRRESIKRRTNGCFASVPCENGGCRPKNGDENIFDDDHGEKDDDDGGGKKDLMMMMMMKKKMGVVQVDLSPGKKGVAAERS